MAGPTIPRTSLLFVQIRVRTGADGYSYNATMMETVSRN